MPKNNPDWEPPEGTRVITPALNTQGPNTAEKLSGVNSGVCPIAINGNQQCGAVLGAQPLVSQLYAEHIQCKLLIHHLFQLRRHLRNEHPCASMCSMDV